MADLQHDIEKYLKGELSPAERHRLEKLALDDPFLAEALEGAEEMGTETFQESVQQINTKLDQRIVKNKKAFGWFWPLRIADAVAQPAATPARRMRVKSRLIPLAIRDDIHATGDTKRKLLIGYSRVFLQVREGEGGLAALPVER